MADTFDRLKSALADRYTIQEEIGSGGMATVYLAEDLKLHRKVALKVLRPELTAALGPERFLREIEIAAKLHHPHILALHDSGEADGFLYYVMPYVEGESLRDRLNREKQLPVEDALQIAREVADALGSAHRHDVIHRDIKPENILLEEGHAVVADFGIARAIHAAGGDKLTETGTTVGTPSYMSPEQAAGSRDLDGRSDIYGLGCVLYEMLVGEAPFTGPTVQSIVHQHMTAEAPSVTVIRSQVPPEIAEAVGRALAKTPADRFNTGEAFADAIATRRAVTPLVPTTRIAGRRGVAFAVAIVAGLLTWIGVATGGFGLLPATAAPEIPRLVVLPFENTGASDDEYFAVGITDEITAKLAGLQGLQVIARQSAMQYKNSDKLPRQIGEELGVDYILEATISWDHAGDRLSKVRVRPQLIDVSTATHVWSAIIDRDMSGIFEVYSSIAEEVVDALGLTLLNPETELQVDPPTNSQQAYEHYLLGNGYYASFLAQGLWNVEVLWNAIDEYEAAIEADPEFALAYARLSMSHSRLWESNVVPRTPEMSTQALDAANQAIRRDPDLPDAHKALGLYYGWVQQDYELALEHLTNALNRAPNDANLLFRMASFQRDVGNLEEAVKLFARAADLDPLSNLIPWAATMVHLMLRDYEQVDRYADRWISLSPTAFGYQHKAMMYLMRDGNVEEARRILQDAAAKAVPVQAALDGPIASHYLKTMARSAWVPQMRPIARILCQADDCRGMADAVVLTRPNDLNQQPRFHNTKARLFGLTGQHDREIAHYDSAAAVLEQLVGAPRDVEYRIDLGVAYAALGDKPAALREAERVVSLSDEGSYLPQVNRGVALAELYVRVGEYDAAIERLEWLLERPSYVSRALLAIDPMWDPLRDHPRFRELIARSENLNDS